VELVGDDRILDEQFKGNDLERVLVGSLKDDGARCTSLLHLKPARGTDAPAVAGFQPCEAMMWHGSTEVVTESLGRGEEGGINDTTDGVNTMVVGASLAATRPVEAGHGLATADVERLAENIFASIFDGFNGGHDPVLL
jgi:hypothetical protein